MTDQPKPLTPEEYAEVTRRLNRRAKAAEALLRWYETTHGNEFGHDHHCRASRWEGGKQVDVPEEPCTCGWRAFEQAIAKTVDQ